METIRNYFEQHKDRFLEELFELIRIPSVSSMEEAKEDMYKAAEAVRSSLLEAGANRAEIMETSGWPVI